MPSIYNDQGRRHWFRLARVFTVTTVCSATALLAGEPPANQDVSADPPAVLRDFRQGGSDADAMTIDYFTYGSDGLCVPALVCGGGLGITYELPGENKERHCGVKEDGTYQGRTFQYVLNAVNVLDTTEAARGFQPGEDYDPDPNVSRPATRLANRLVINPERLFKRFMDTFEAVEGVRPNPKDISTGLEVYPKAPAAFRKKIIRKDDCDMRYYSLGASPHVKILKYENGRIIQPLGKNVALSCIVWRRTEHADFTAGEAVDLMGNRLPGSDFAAWGWQNGYGGLQYGDYFPGLGMYFVPALALGESWDFRYDGNTHILKTWQQDPPCWIKPVIAGRYLYAGKAYNSEFAPVVFGRVPPVKTVDPARPTQQVMVFGDANTWYAPQDAFNYEDDKLDVMKWQRQGMGTARIERGKHFFQGGAALLFPGTDVPNSMRKPIDPEGLKDVTLTTHWFRLPEEGYDSAGAFLTVEFAKAPKLTLSAGADGILSVSRPGEPELRTSLALQTGWNAVHLAYDHCAQRLYLRIGKKFATANDRRITFPAEGGITALEIGKNASASPKGNVLFDSIWINPTDTLSDNFEYASLGEMRDSKVWTAGAQGFDLEDQCAYSGQKSLKLLPNAKGMQLSRSLIASGMSDHTFQLAWFRREKGGQDSFVELRSPDGKAFLRFRGDDGGRLLYSTEKSDWVTTSARFHPEFLNNWHELAVIFDTEGNAYLRLNLDWVAQANGLPLVIPNRGMLSVLCLGRTGGAEGVDVLFDDLRIIRNSKLVGNATIYSSTFEYPLDSAECLKQHGWKNAAKAGARIEAGKGAAGGRRCLLLPGNAPAETPVTRSFKPALSDVTAEFSWYHNPDEEKQTDAPYIRQADAGYVRLVDAQGNRLSFSADAQGLARYRVNDQPWKETGYMLAKGWNKTRVVLAEGKPVSFWMAPQRPGISPKGQWKLIETDTYTTKKLQTDFCQKLEQTFSGLARVEVARKTGSSADFLFDDLFVLTNQETERTLRQPDFGNNRMTFTAEIDNRLANRDWPQIEKSLVEKGLLKPK
jgi:hypothetical protein